MTEKNENGAVGRFALEEEYSSSMAEVLKAAWDWIESSEIECGPGPLWGSLEATATATPPTPCMSGAFLQHPSHSPRKSPDGRTHPFMSPVFSSGGDHAPIFSRVKHQGSPEVQVDKSAVMYRESPYGVDNRM